jgi:hypothetical protein
MSVFKISLGLGIVLLLFACNMETPRYELVWSDEFDYTGLPDSSKWAYDSEGNSAGWGNNEAQFYTEARI